MTASPFGGRGPRGARLGIAIAAAALASPLAACTTTIVPPAAPAAPQAVFVLDHGRHASLVVPGPDGGIVRYSYGDWRWYALRKTGPLQGTSAVLWPTRAALGRRELPGPPEADAVVRQVRVGIEGLYEVTVDAGRVEALRRDLDSIFHAGAETRVDNPAYDLEFVHHPKPYWLFRMSNQMVARWLEALGCRVRGPALFSRWRVEGEGADGPPPRHQAATIRFRPSALAR